MISDTARVHIVAHTMPSRIRQAKGFLNRGASICPPRLRLTNHSVEAETAPIQK